MKINLYDVDREYTEYLQRKEIEQKGYTTVPNTNYEDYDQYRKFFCGPIIRINQIDYYVGASHKTLLNDDVFPINFPDEEGVIKGTLRFQYMIPVAPSALEWRDIRKEKEPKRKVFLFKYLKDLELSKNEIQRMGYKVYKKQINGELSDFLKDKFNDFKFLESKMIQYELNKRLGLLHTSKEVEINYDQEVKQHIIDYGDYKRIIETVEIRDFNTLAHIVDADMDAMEYLNEVELSVEQEDDIKHEL